MKLVKKFAAAVLFVSVLAVPTLAGDMITPGKTDPPPPPGNSISSPTTTDDNATTAQQTDETSPSTTDDGSQNLLYEAYMAMLGLY